MLCLCQLVLAANLIYTLKYPLIFSADIKDIQLNLFHHTNEHQTIIYVPYWTMRKTLHIFEHLTGIT